MPDLNRLPLSLGHRVRAPSSPARIGERPPLLILLHGVGSNELAMAGLAPAFDPRCLVLSARAPRQVGPFSWAWLDVTFMPGGPVIDAEEARQAWLAMAAFVDEAVDAYGADPRRVFLGGFSQGGILALMTLLTSPERLAGAFCMSGRLAPEVLPHAAPPDRLAGKPVLIVHGRDDDVLGVTYARDARRQLAELPVALTYRELDLGHTTSPESVEVVAAWLTDRLDALDPAG
jgi:phospholipase/carboxylesterase